MNVSDVADLGATNLGNDVPPCDWDLNQPCVQEADPPKIHLNKCTYPLFCPDDNVKNAITVPYNSNMPSLNPKPGNVLVRYDVVKQSDIEGRYELRVQKLVRNNNNGWDTIIDEKITYETTALAVNPFEDNITYIDTRD